MVQLEEMNDGEPPEAQRQAAPAAPADSANNDPRGVPGAELSAEVVPNLWLASEMALDDLGLLSDNGVTHLLALGTLSLVTPEALRQGLAQVPGTTPSIFEPWQLQRAHLRVLLPSHEFPW